MCKRRWEGSRKEKMVEKRRGGEELRGSTERHLRENRGRDNKDRVKGVEKRESRGMGYDSRGRGAEERVR